MVRDFDREVAELQIRIAVLNGYIDPGTPVTEVLVQVRPEKGEARSSPELCDKTGSGH